MILVMKLKRFFAGNFELMIVASVLLSMWSLITAINYSSPNIYSNPFVVLAVFFLLRGTVQVLTHKNRGQSREMAQREEYIMYPAMLVTSIILAMFCIPEVNSLISLFLWGVAGWLFGTGLVGTVVSGLVIWTKRLDSKDFREEMREVAERARREEALAHDLAEFLADTGAKKSDSDVES